MRSPRPFAAGAPGAIFTFVRASAALALASVVLAPAAASAQTIPSPYRFIDTRQELGLFVGAVHADPGSLDFGPGDGVAFGARYGYQLAGPFSVEAVATGISSTRDIIDPVADEGSRAVGEADVLLGAIEGRLNFSLTGNRTWNGISPHILLGGGGVFDLSGESEADLAIPLDQRFTFSTSFLGSLGAGVRWLPTDRITVRADGLLKLWRITTPPGYLVLENELGTVEESQWVRAPTLTLGAAYRF